MADNLRLTKRKAMTFIRAMCEQLDSNLCIRLDPDVSVGFGRYLYDGKSLLIGVREIYARRFDSFVTVRDEVFTNAVVTLYHEYGHYLDDVCDDTSEHILLSTISTHNNPMYRMDCWREFPHEISAEHTGVMLAMSTMSELFGDVGANCVFNYVHSRIENSSYFLSMSDVKSWTPDGIDDAFRTAMDRSLLLPRRPYAGFRRGDSGVASFLRSVDGISYVQMLANAIPGGFRDRILAAINIQADRTLMDFRLNDNVVSLPDISYKYVDFMEERTMENKIEQTIPSTTRYVKTHGNGITGAGIDRAMALLPALRAIADPDADMSLTAQDLQDVKSCLEAYQKYGSLQTSGSFGVMWSDMGENDDLDQDVVSRLSAQRCEDGSTKYRAVFQAVPLAMTPSRDLAHEGYWHMLANMAGYRNMDAYTDGSSAGRSMASALDFDAGSGKPGMAGKLAACWWSLDRAAPCGLSGAENSVRAMQFCAMSNLAQLDGYDLVPDEEHARNMGCMLASGFEDMDGFKKLVEESIIEHPQPQAQKTGSAYARLLAMVGDTDASDGHGGNGGGSAPCPGDEPEM